MSLQTIEAMATELAGRNCGNVIGFQALRLNRGIFLAVTCTGPDREISATLITAIKRKLAPLGALPD